MAIPNPQSSSAEARPNFVQETLQTLLTRTALRQWEIAKRLNCSQPHISYLLNSTAPNARPSAAMVEGLKSLREEYAHVFDEKPEPQAA